MTNITSSIEANGKKISVNDNQVEIETKDIIIKLKVINKKK